MNVVTNDLLYSDKKISFVAKKKTRRDIRPGKTSFVVLWLSKGDENNSSSPLNWAIMMKFLFLRVLIRPETHQTKTELKLRPVRADQICFSATTVVMCCFGLCLRRWKWIFVLIWTRPNNRGEHENRIESAKRFLWELIQFLILNVDRTTYTDSFFLCQKAATHIDTLFARVCNNSKTMFLPIPHLVPVFHSPPRNREKERERNHAGSRIRWAGSQF